MLLHHLFRQVAPRPGVFAASPGQLVMPMILLLGGSVKGRRPSVVF